MPKMLDLSDCYAQNDSVHYNQYLNKLTDQIATNFGPTVTAAIGDVHNAYSINNTGNNAEPLPISSTLWPDAPSFIPYQTYTNTEPPLPPLPPLISNSIGPNCRSSKSNVWFTKFWNNYPITDEWYGTADLNNNPYQTYSAYSNGYEPSRSPLPEPIGSGRGVGLTLESQPTFSLSPTDWSYDSYDNMYIQPKIRRRMPSQMECVFCKNNGEPPELYKTHILKDPECRIVCPILRAYDCPICHNGGGDKAHTVRYCPLNRAGIQIKMERINRLEQMVPEFGYSKRGRGGGKSRAKYY